MHVVTLCVYILTIFVNQVPNCEMKLVTLNTKAVTLKADLEMDNVGSTMARVLAQVLTLNATSVFHVSRGLI